MANERTISFPFRIQNGSVAATTDYQKVWQDRVLAAVGTAIGERPMDRVNYGTTIAKTLWANPEEAAEIATEQVPIAFAKHLPYLSLSGVEVYEVEGNDFETEHLLIEVNYILPNGDEVSSEAVVGSIEPTGEFSTYDSYTVPAYDGNDSDIEVD